MKTLFGRLPLFRQSTNNCARLQIAETVLVPPKSQFVFQTWVDRPFQGPEVLEPTKSLSSKGLHLARSLCDPEASVVTISILNIREKPVTLASKTIIGTVESVNEIVTENIGSTVHKHKDQELPPHLQPLLYKTQQNLTEVQIQKLIDLILDFQDIFHKPGEKLGQTDITKHEINTGHNQPIKMPLRRYQRFRNKS